MEQLVHYFVTAATSEHVSVVLAPFAMAAKELISKIELKPDREFHTLFQVFMLASTAEKATEADLVLLRPILNALSSIPAQESRDAAVLAWIKGLVDAWMEKWDGTEGEVAERNPDLEPTGNTEQRRRNRRFGGRGIVCDGGVPGNGPHLVEIGWSRGFWLLFSG